VLGKWVDTPVQEDQATLCDASDESNPKPEGVDSSVVFYTKAGHLEGLLEQKLAVNIRAL
jgi:hypothetical protein